MKCKIYFANVKVRWIKPYKQTKALKLKKKMNKNGTILKIM